MDMVAQEKLVNVWGFSVMLFLCFALVSVFMVPAVSVTIQGTLPPTHGVIPIGLFWGWFLINLLFTRIRVDAEGVTIRTPTGVLYFSFEELEEVEWASGGHEVSFPGGISHLYVVPFRYRELAEAIQRKAPLEILTVPTRLPKPPSRAILFVPLLVWVVLARVLRLGGVLLNPVLVAVIVGVAAFSSSSYYVYASWNRYRIGHFGRLGSALASGLLSGGILSCLASSLVLYQVFKVAEVF